MGEKKKRYITGVTLLVICVITIMAAWLHVRGPYDGSGKRGKKIALITLPAAMDRDFGIPAVQRHRRL